MTAVLSQARYQVLLNSVVVGNYVDATASTLWAESMARLNPQDRVVWYDTATSDLAIRSAGRGQRWNLCMYEGAI